jgi:large subunit ribosomal protein L19
MTEDTKQDEAVAGDVAKSDASQKSAVPTPQATPDVDITASAKPEIAAEETADAPAPEPTPSPEASDDAPSEDAVPEANSEPVATREGAPLIGAPQWDPQPGQVVRVHLRIMEAAKKKKGEDRERIQIFEGTVIARRHGSEPGATFTVRKVTKGNFAVERIFPLHAPTIANVEVVKAFRTRRAKLHFLRFKRKKRKRLHEIRD